MTSLFRLKMEKLITKRPTRLNGKTLVTGTVLELDSSLADKWVKLGFAEVAEVHKEHKEPKPKPKKQKSKKK